MFLLQGLDTCVIQDLDGQWWYCDGGAHYKDTPINYFHRCNAEGDPVDPVDRMYDSVSLEMVASFDEDALRELVQRHRRARDGTPAS